MPTLEVFGASIVAVGSFNPPLLNVDWLSQNGLIGKGDADSARARDEYLVTHQVTRFQTDSISVQTVETQLALHSVGPVTPALADFIIGVFELLPHTPVTAVGLNFMAHYRIANIETYHRIGDTLAPKELWDELFPGKISGLADLTMHVQKGVRTSTEVRPNQERLTVQPSGKFLPGIFLQINNHFGALGAEQDKPIQSASDAAGVVRDHWETCFSGSQVLFERILEIADRGLTTAPQGNK